MSTGTLTALSRQECLELLRHRPLHVGRLAVIELDGRPLVVPVNYRLDRDAVIVRLEAGSQVADAALERPVAFEVDEVDEAWEEGWSVVVQARAEQITDPDELARVQQLPLRPWAPGERGVHLRIPLDKVTGRRID
ncbi:MAG TPA: pyridoxamine 5'-phosphate oxidase family protein [Egibacteraceae bacterium]